MTTSTKDFVVLNGLQIGGYITSVGGSTPTNGQLLIGDTTNNRFSVGSLTATNGLSITPSAGSLALTSNATDANVASTIVSRDASGNFTAGTITAALAGNAATSTKLQTARTINGVSFDGSTNISFTTDSVAEGTTNLYFTTARASAAAPVQSVFGRAGNVVLASSDVTGALGYTPINPNVIGAANGLATLDSSGHVPMAQMPPAVVGGLNYQGTWNASTNTPTLTSGTGTKGWMYKVSVAGTTNIDGNSQWNVGDIIAFNGTTWDKIDGISSEVTSVFGRTGDVSLLTSDIISAWGTQPANSFLASPSTGSGSINFRTISPSDLPLATTSAVGAVSISTGLTVTSGVLTANVVTVAGRIGNVVLSVTDVSGAAPLASPALTGTPTAPTPVATDNSTTLATTAYVNTALTNAGVTPGGGNASFANGTFSGSVKIKQSTYDTQQTSTSSTSAYTIYSVAVTGASTLKFVAQVVDASNNINSAEFLVITDATNIWMTTYAMVNSNGSLGTFSAQILTGTLQLQFTPASTTAMTVKVMASMLV
jgi:hypothetical protein